MRRAKDTSPSRGAKKFGDMVTVDFVTPYAKERIEGLGNTIKGILFYDLATGWLQFQPQTSNSATETMRSFLYIVGNIKKIKLVISDGAAEFISAFKQLGVVHRETLPGHPETNSLIEGQVQVLARGTRALLAASGMPIAFWVHAAQCFVICETFNLTN